MRLYAVFAYDEEQKKLTLILSYQLPVVKPLLQKCPGEIKTIMSQEPPTPPHIDVELPAHDPSGWDEVDDKIKDYVKPAFIAMIQNALNDPRLADKLIQTTNIIIDMNCGFTGPKFPPFVCSRSTMQFLLEQEFLSRDRLPLPHTMNRELMSDDPNVINTWNANEQLKHPLDTVCLKRDVTCNMPPVEPIQFNTLIQRFGAIYMPRIPIQRSASTNDKDSQVNSPQKTHLERSTSSFFE